MDNPILFLVGPTDTDSYHIVHHPRYLVWCEEAIYRFMQAHPEQYAADGYHMERMQCRFQSPARLHDTLHAAVAASGMSFRVQLTNHATGKPVMSAKITMKEELP